MNFNEWYEEKKMDFADLTQKGCLQLAWAAGATSALRVYYEEYPLSNFNDWFEENSAYLKDYALQDAVSTAYKAGWDRKEHKKGNHPEFNGEATLGACPNLAVNTLKEEYPQVLVLLTDSTRYVGCKKEDATCLSLGDAVVLNGCYEANCPRLAFKGPTKSTLQFHGTIQIPWSKVYMTIQVDAEVWRPLIVDAKKRMFDEEVV